MIEQVDKRFWVYGESLFPGSSHHWVQDTRFNRLRWFLAFPYAYSPPSPNHRAEIQIERVYIEYIPDPENRWPPENYKFRIHVIVKNVGPETVFSYAVFVAQTIPASLEANSTSEAEETGGRAFVIHDRAGNIISAGVPLDKSQGKIELVAEQGQIVTEVDLPDFFDLANMQTTFKKDIPIFKNYKVELGNAYPKLTKK